MVTDWEKMIIFIYNLKQITMTTSEIRAEIAELINSGMMKLPRIVSYFKTYRPDANISNVKEEAKELLAQVRETIKRGY